MSLIITLLLSIIWVYVFYLEIKKRTQYKDDERYQEIVKKRDRVLLICYDGLATIGLIVFDTLTLPGFLGDITISFKNNSIPMFIFSFLIVRNILSYLVTIYYDKKFS